MVHTWGSASADSDTHCRQLWLRVLVTNVFFGLQKYFALLSLFCDQVNAMCYTQSPLLGGMGTKMSRKQNSSPQRKKAQGNPVVGWGGGCRGEGRRWGWMKGAINGQI